MVVIAAAVCTKSGRALVSRQFVDVSRVRIEGLLAAFPKLIDTDKEHTFIETENVRYVYQPIEKLYMLIVTNKASNILEDLNTLQLLAKLVPEYYNAASTHSLYELVFAFDEVVGNGYREKLSLAQIRTLTEMDSHEERIHEIMARSKEREAKEEMQRRQKEIELKNRSSGTMRGFGSDSRHNNNPSSYASSHGVSSDPYISKTPAPTQSYQSSSKTKSTSAPKKAAGMKLGSAKGGKANDYLKEMMATGELVEETHTDLFASPSSNQPTQSETTIEEVHIVAEEKMVIALDQDGALETFELKGELNITINNPQKARAAFSISKSADSAIQFRTHPKMNKQKFNKENILVLRDESLSFPANGEALSVLKWRFTSQDESKIPLLISCWPSPGSDTTVVNVEYELLNTNLSFTNVIVEIPIPGSNSPVVEEADGSYGYNSREEVLQWRLQLIDSSSPDGRIEFKLPGSASNSHFFPINVSLSSSNTFCALNVNKVISLETQQELPFSFESSLTSDSFQIAHN